ncbi:hypothetical protein FM019_09855 [Aliiglaciecola sp. M165]|nr:hypothetical protein FM019_09855 [Aliiglaciecola sp. M165]
MVCFAFIGFTANAQDATLDGYSAQSCPAQFHSLPLYPEAKLCQLFDDALPASLTYHATTDQQSTRDFYTSELGEADSIQELKGRIVLEYENANKIIVISKDGAGTQVDVLVKST